ncbi:MAG: SAM-dependent methyltransferase [Clostridia bacterium]|nr:SAM-dependent methyltransferase [Clostridia bacterium]
MISLDNRLGSVLDIFPSCRLAADIGADHGKLALALVSEGKAEKVIVTDISRDSLRKAETLFAAHNASHLAVFVLGDGMTVLPETPDAVSMCGMGGKTISRILENGIPRIYGAEVILSPHTEIPIVRQTVYRLGYHITSERCVVASGRFYVILSAKPGHETISEEEMELGPCLYRHRDDPVVKDYYLWRAKVLSAGRNETSKEKAGWYFNAL